MDTRTVVERFFDRLTAGAVEDVAALVSDPVDWYIPGHEAIAPWLGRRTRRHEVEEVYRLLFRNVEPIRFAMHDIVVEGNVAVASGEFASRMLATGNVYESLLFVHFTVVDGQIVRYRLLEDTYGLVRAMSAHPSHPAV
ncbi:nuclear transport factor 2 family protein [Pendulispora rubella]|uniref:Nuclear transport factor 2 family protein n=1 Tax=Pendulispora rubella TaxID=2741070 RepID=A0ABZ2KW63_9BACT